MIEFALKNRKFLSNRFLPRVIQFFLPFSMPKGKALKGNKESAFFSVMVKLLHPLEMDIISCTNKELFDVRTLKKWSVFDES